MSRYTHDRRQMEVVSLPMSDTDTQDAEMWASVYNLLHTTPVEQSSNCESCSPPKPKRIRVYTNKAEVQQLEQEIQDLQAQLIDAKVRASCKTDICMWERAAAQQRVEKNKSLEEKQQLQLAVQERSDYIQRLQKIIFKTPRWTALPDVTEVNKVQSLPSDPIRRIAAMHAMADQMYKRQQNAFIQAGAFDLDEDMCRGDPISLPNQQIGFRAVNHINLPAPFKVVAEACWSILSGKEIPSVVLPEEDEIWECIDEHTSYERYKSYRNGINWRSNIIRKYYEENDRVVVVWVSVVHDEMTEPAHNDNIDETNGWWTYTANPNDPTKSRITIVRQSNVSRILEHQEIDSNPEEVISVLKRFVAKRGNDFESTPSFLKPMLERGKRLRLPIKKAIERAIINYSSAESEQ